MNKEKQIEEMAREMCWDCARESPCSLAKDGGMCNSVRKQATALYNAGYRKKSEGEWVELKRFYASGKTLIHYQCNLCGVYLAKQANFCPNCGARMKGV